MKVDKFKVLQYASGAFLTEEIPDDWESISEKKRISYVNSNVCEQYECADPVCVIDLIDDSAMSLLRFIGSL